MQNRGKSRVCHYWKPSTEGNSWREWIDQKEWVPPINPQVWSELSIEIQKRQILHNTSENKIRWGQNLAGHFDIKEAYRYIAQHDQIQPDPK